MNPVLHDFDLFPMVFLAGREETVTIHSLASRGQDLLPGETYTVRVMEAQKAENSRFPGTDCTWDYQVTADENHSLVFSLTCAREGMYIVHLLQGDNWIARLHMYALDSDMAGRYPFRGDLHMHTCRSDGHERPEMVAANYRGHGYDFTVISDHYRYYPSLEARAFFRLDKQDKSDLTDLLIVQGEEVHLPLNDVHYVNFGGHFSINALVTPGCNQEKAGDDKAWRSFDGQCPEPMTVEEYKAMVARRAQSVPRELESERLSFAAAGWIHEMQQKAGGLGIFPHPYWLCSTMQLSEDYVRFFYENHPFDAFEVLGGENYYQHNGFQTSFYYEMKARGLDYPVVGSTDSHGSTENNRNALICSTLVFAPANTTDDLVDAIKAKYSVAVDTISPEYRLVGDFRWVKYGSFLLENWYPIHDLACQAEGYYMGRYAEGDADAEGVLKAMKGHVPGMMKKYFHL